MDGHYGETIETCKSFIPQLCRSIDEFRQVVHNIGDSPDTELVSQIIDRIELITAVMEELQKEGHIKQESIERLKTHFPALSRTLLDGRMSIVAEILFRDCKPALRSLYDELSGTRAVAVLFSRDRALQLDATLHSFSLHCVDSHSVDIRVLYHASTAVHERQYNQLKLQYPYVEFIAEVNFKEQVLSCIRAHSYVLFLVDDNLFVRDFSINSICDLLDVHSSALGYSLRLGTNTVYCYPMQQRQSLPKYRQISDDVLIFDWTLAQLDFGYPLEVSSSVYRVEDLLLVMSTLMFAKPNSLEQALSDQRSLFAPTKKHLLCSKYSLTFCNPVNIVQQEVSNISGKTIQYSVEQFAKLFDDGYRIDIERYNDFTPTGCHQEAEMTFVPKAETSTQKPDTGVSPTDAESMIELLVSKGLIDAINPIRLHLGCGEQYFNGYINIDYPSARHNTMQISADVYADILDLKFPSGLIDEIRLHHVFEHFNRVTALALLIRWHAWLRLGGKLVIETPDLMGSAKTLVSDAPYREKMAVVRHLAGDQAASWAYHVDHWFPERFQHTLEELGFNVIDVDCSSWNHPPHLSNVLVTAEKRNDVCLEDQFRIAVNLLWHSAVDQSEKSTHETWTKQLHQLVFGTGLISTSTQMAIPTSHGQMNSYKQQDLPLEYIHDFNQRERDKWVRTKAITVPDGARVLDVGAGTCPYRELFSHCDYVSHDFKQYSGVKLGGTHEYGQIDIVSPIDEIPVDDATFDAILCTEVLEHVPDPIAAIREMARILKPKGRIFITAPLGSGLHQLPFHFYGGYTPEWYKRFFARYSIDAVEISPNGGFFRHLAQECIRAASILRGQPEITDELVTLLNEQLPRQFFTFDSKYFEPSFTVGFHVEGIKA